VSKVASVAQLIALKPAGRINPTRSMTPHLPDRQPETAI
jgi:hypothetical protein